MKRRRYSIQEKAALVQQNLNGESLEKISMETGVHVVLISRWRKEYRDKGYIGKLGGKSPSKHLSPEDAQEEIKHLKRKLEEKTLEVMVLRDLVKKTKQTTKELVMLVLKWSTLGYKVKHVCRIVGLSRATYYANILMDHHPPKPIEKTTRSGSLGFSYQLNGEKVKDDEIKNMLTNASLGEGYNYGYRKMTFYLRKKKNLYINHKKVYRLCMELKILRPANKSKTRVPRKLARNRVITGPNQLWQGDIKYGYISGQDRTFYVLSFIDVFDRIIVAYVAGLTCRGHHASEALKQGLLKRDLFGKEQLPIIRTDNGSQFTGFEFASACHDLHIEHERIPPRTPNMNAYIEAYHSILEDDLLSLVEFDDIDDVKNKLARYVKFYNQVRIHSSLQYCSPEEFHQRYMQGQITAADAHL